MLTFFCLFMMISLNFKVLYCTKPLFKDCNIIYINEYIK